VVGNARLSASAGDDLRAHGLSQLLGTFLQMLSSSQRLKGTLSQITESDLKAEVARVTDRLAKEKEGSALYRSLQGSLDIANKRIENLTRARESLVVVEAELDRIEKQFALLVEESSVTSDPDSLTTRLDSVMQSLQDTSRWLQDNREFLGTMDESATDVAVVPQRTAIKE
jgi:hypothetical protein